MNKIVTRFAPSPTGTLHIGAARTALFNFAFSKKNGGEIILRIEDTDKERSKKEYEDDIIESLKWLGITHSKLYRQSERGELYESHIRRLIEKGYAYVAEDEIIRFKNLSTEVVFEDAVRGRIKTETADLGDFIIARGVRDPLYHLAAVIDDFEMGVTHIIRGEDHISNTPRQILIQEALGAPTPVYVHIPLILAPDRSKLSKRHGATSISDYRSEGYLASALANFMALLGWSPQRRGAHHAEIFDLDEFVEMFSIDGIQKSGAVFDIEKLKWVNREHIRRMTQGALQEAIEAFLPEPIWRMSEASRAAFIKTIAEKIYVFGDIKTLFERGELSYFFEDPKYDAFHLLGKDNKDSSAAKKHLEFVLGALSSIATEQFKADSVKESVWTYAGENGRGSVLWPFRYALSGREKSPDPFAIAEILGKEETLKRLEHAILILK